MLAMICMHTIGFSYVVRPSNTTRLIKLLQPQSFLNRSEQNDILSAYNIGFIADPAMNTVSQCLIDSNIETKNKHHVHCPSFEMYTFLTDSQRE